LRWGSKCLKGIDMLSQRKSVLFVSSESLRKPSPLSCASPCMRRCMVDTSVGSSYRTGAVKADSSIRRGREYEYSVVSYFTSGFATAYRKGLGSDGPHFVSSLILSRASCTFCFENACLMFGKIENIHPERRRDFESSRNPFWFCRCV